jgi:hypothetical protein
LAATEASGRALAATAAAAPLAMVFRKSRRESPLLLIDTLLLSLLLIEYFEMPVWYSLE